MKKMNNKGYMLVEIVLASVIAFTFALFIIDLTIKLKNKNDDTLVETLVKTDQAIAMNKIMEIATQERDQLCKDGKTFTVGDNDRVLKYGSEPLVIFNDYVEIENVKCQQSTGSVRVFIPLTVSQIPNKNFNIDVNYKYKINDMAFPYIEIEEMNVDDVEGYVYGKEYKATLHFKDNNGLKKTGSKPINLRYDWLTTPLACNQLKNTFSVSIYDIDEPRKDDNNNIKYISVTKDYDNIIEEEIELTITGINGNGKLYVCNEDEMEDVSGNKTPVTIFSAEGSFLYLDSTPPTCKLNITRTSDNLMTISLTGEDNAKVSEYALYADGDAPNYHEYESGKANGSITVGNNVEADYIFNANKTYNGETIDGNSLTFHGYVKDGADNTSNECSVTIYKYVNKKCTGGTKIKNLNFCQ